VANPPRNGPYIKITKCGDETFVYVCYRHRGGGNVNMTLESVMQGDYFSNITLCTISYGTPKPEMVDSLVMLI